MFDKHTKLCQKSDKKRKTFNSKNKRILDSEHAMILKAAEQEEKRKSKMGFNKDNKLKDAVQKKIPKWKIQSEQFRNQIKSTGGEKMEEIYDDLIYCEFCNRKYKDDPYQRHLDRCKKNFEKNGAKNQYNGNAKTSSNAITSVNTNTNGNAKLQSTNSLKAKPSFNTKFGK